MGEPAKTQELSNFKNTVGSLKRLIGRRYAEKDIAAIEQQYLNCELVEMEGGELGARVMFKDESQEFTFTQLMAMYLTKLKQTTEAELGRDMSDVVVSIPAYYTDAQRRALISAGEIAGLNILRMIPDLTAAALQWGITKTDLPEPEQGVKYVAFVDVGQSDTSVEIIAFNKGKMSVKAIAFERHLGGRDFDQALLNHFVDEFKTKYKMDVRSNKKALFRLRSACERVKKVLSANSQAPLNIECLMDDKDVSSMVQRADFEQWVQPLIDRLDAPLNRALDIAGVTKEDIDVVEIIGGTTRIPMVKQKICNFFGKELSTTLNQDECVAKGCAFMCAILSPVFRTREFKVEDVYAYPIKLTYDPADSGKNEPREMVAFSSNTPTPCTKLLTFYRRESFDLEAFYSDEGALPEGASAWIGKYTIKGVEAKGTEPCTVKVKVRLNPNGILEVGGAQVHEEVEVAASEEKENAKAAVDKKPVETPAAANGNADEDAMDAEPTAPAASVPEEENKPKKKVIKKDLPVVAVAANIPAAQILKLREFENSLISNDKLVIDTLDRRNALEEYVYDMRGKLESTYADYVTADVKEKLLKMLAETEDWLYGEGEEATKSVYVSKLDELHALGKPIARRYKEMEERPAAAESFRATVREWTEIAASKDAKYEHITAEDRQKVTKECQTKLEWLNKKLAEQDASPKHADPVLTVEKLNKEREALIYTVFPIMNKAKPAPPKVEKKEEKPQSPTSPAGEEKKAETNGKQQEGQPQQPQEKKQKQEGETEEMDVD